MIINSVVLTQELFLTEVSFVKFMENALFTNQFYQTQLQKFLECRSSISKLVSEYQQQASINSDNYVLLLKSFIDQMTELFNSDEYMSTHMVLATLPQTAHYICGRLPRYSLLMNDLQKKETNEEIKNELIIPFLTKVRSICNCWNAQLGVNAKIMESKKVWKVRNFVHDLMVADVKIKVKKSLLSFVYKNKTFKSGMILFPKLGNQIVLLKGVGQQSTNSMPVEFGSKDQIVFDRYEIIKCIDLLTCEISSPKPSEEGGSTMILISTKSTKLSIEMDTTLNIKVWDLICKRRYKLPLKLNIIKTRSLCDVLFQFQEDSDDDTQR